MGLFSILYNFGRDQAYPVRCCLPAQVDVFESDWKTLLTIVVGLLNVALLIVFIRLSSNCLSEFSNHAFPL